MNKNMIRKIIRGNTLQTLHFENAECAAWHFQNILIAQMKRSTVEPDKQSLNALVMWEFIRLR